MQVNGTPVNFGFTGANGMTIAGLSGLLTQNAETTAGADKEEVRNGVGDKVTRSWYDLHTKASLDFVITGTGLANAITNTVLAPFAAGGFINITACASMPDLVGSTWEVQDGARITGSNTTSKKLSLPLEKRAGITGPAGP